MYLNAARAAEVMDRHGLDGLIAASAENVPYVSGFNSWTLYTYRDLEAYAVLARSGRTALIVPIDGLDWVAEAGVDASAIYTHGSYHIGRDGELAGAEERLWTLREGSPHFAEATQALRSALSDLGVSRPGLDDLGMRQDRWAALSGLLKAAPASDLFREIRLVKTEAEIDALRSAAACLETGMAAAFAVMAPGVTERELEAAFRAAVARTGAMPGHWECTAGTRAGASFPASEYRLRAGDVVRCDCGCRLAGYWADSGRTRALGAAVPPIGYDAIRRGMEAILARVGPGVTGAELFEAGVGAVRRHGVARYARHHVGHGIGREMYEAPRLTPTSQVRLAPGMVVNVELPYYVLGLGGLQLEETLVVRAHGYERLTSAQW